MSEADQWDGGRAECNCPGILKLRAEAERLKKELENVKAERDLYEHKWRTDAWD